MSIERVREYLKEFDMDTKIREFSVSSATVALAAEALGCEPARIAKSLAFKTDSGCIMVVAAGDARVDNKKYKAQFGLKAKMLTVDETYEMTGHMVGGVCPFALPEGVRVYFDESLKRFETVFPACGSTNSAIELTIAELERLVPSAEWVSVCKI